ncbi:MAG: hypothetical protein ACK4YV_08395 [Emticicia sp.]
MVEIETANGIAKSKTFEVHQMKSMGIIKNRFQIQVYDFLSHGIFSNSDGLLGLDFLEGTKFCIDTDLNEITINNK